MKRWKRLIGVTATLFLLAGLMLVPATTVYAVNAISITLPNDTAGDATMAPGATFSMQVVVDDITNFDSVNYDVVATPLGVVDLTSVDNGLIGAVAVPTVTPAPVNQDGVTTNDWWRIVSNISGTTGASGGGYLAVLNFTVTGVDTDTVVITLANGTVSDITATEITCTWAGTGTLTVADFKVTDIAVVGDVTSTTEGYINPGDALQQTTFTMTPTVTGGNGALTYAWTFGTDGTGSDTAAIPSDVVYSTAGAKTIALVVTDALSSTSDATGMTGGAATIYDSLVAGYSGDTGTVGHALEGVVYDNAGTWAGLTAGTSNVVFTDSTAGGKATYTYSWDFNNDATEDSTVASPTYDFVAFANATGATFRGEAYSVVLTATDSLTASDGDTQVVTIYVAGDVDGNVGITAGDVTGIERIVALVDASTWTSDTNNDGVFNAMDITKVELLSL